jgi:outer membrane protein OmpA-like peptidoglycan-associated protein
MLRIFGLVVATAVLGSAPARAQSYGLGVSGGAAVDRIEKQAGKTTSRNGGAYSLYLSGEMPAGDAGLVGLDLGFHQVFLAGEKSGENQNAYVRAGLIDAAYDHRVGDALVGLALAAIVGKGTALEYEKRDQVHAAFGIGPEVKYRLDGALGDWRVGLGYLAYLNIDKHTLHEIKLSAELWLPAGGRHDDVAAAAPVPVAPTPVEPAPTPAPEAPAPAAPVTTGEGEAAPTPQAPHTVIIQLDAKTIEFAVSTPNLSPASRRRADSIARALKASGLWSKVEVAGHSDGSGVKWKNEVLAKDRAIAVRRVFLQAGLSTARVGARGYGAKELLPGLPVNAPEHRRVELRFKDVKDEPALRALVQKAIEEAGQP